MNEEVACDDEQAEADKQTNAPHTSLSETVTKLRGDGVPVKLAIVVLVDINDSEHHGDLGVASIVPSVARHDGWCWGRSMRVLGIMEKSRIRVVVKECLQERGGCRRRNDKRGESAEYKSVRQKHSASFTRHTPATEGSLVPHSVTTPAQTSTNLGRLCTRDGGIGSEHEQQKSLLFALGECSANHLDWIAIVG